MPQSFELKVCQTTCPYCGVGCGVDATIKNGQLTAVTGSESHPANKGKLCVKGSNLAETVDLDGRLLTPQIGNENSDWETATELVANKFTHFINTYGADSVAFYVSGQILTEDYYVANKLMKGYIGSANIDTNSRLCMSSAVAGYKRAFGSDTVPCSYEDLSNTDLLVLVGSNAAWTHPVLFQQMEKAKQENPNLKIVVIDPRKTATAQFADLYLPLKPGSDVALFNGLLNYLIATNNVDKTYISQYCQGFEATAETVRKWDLATTAQATNIEQKDLLTYFNAFAQSPSAVTFYSQGVNQSSQGVDKCNAIINCHLATGKIGKLGSGPFSITGQPNAMGGREVGGLANMLAAHMNIENESHRDLVQEFWQSPTIPTEHGAKAVDMFDRIKQGKIKAVWIMATNPLVSLPNRNEVKQALEQCEFVVVSDCMEKNDTLAYADVKFPATTWSEKDGTVTNSERRISRQRGIVAAPGQSRHDWKIICDVAQKMGFVDAFDYQHPAEIFNEHAALSAYKNGKNEQPKRDFDLSGLQNLSIVEYENLNPIQWPVNKAFPNGCAQMFADGQFFTPSGKAQFIDVDLVLPKNQPNTHYPLVLNTGRLRDQWHTMTRTGKSKTLAKHTGEPFVTIHPQDATTYHINNDELVCVKSEFGEVTVPAKIDESVQQGDVFIPIHWTQMTAKTANVANCFSSDVDPLSGQPESKFVPVTLTKVQPTQFIQIFSREEIELTSDYWAKIKIDQGFEYKSCSFDAESDPYPTARKMSNALGDWSYFENSFSGLKTALCIKDEQLQFVAFFADYKPEINSDWIESLFVKPSVTSSTLSRVLSANVEPEFLNGRTICSCFKIGESQIIDAIKNDDMQTVEDLGQHLKCGTNCGSCKSELRSLISEHGNPATTPSRFDKQIIPTLTV